MRWYRMYHGTCTDPKLIEIADTAKVKRSAVLAAWVAVLEIASSSSDRGSTKHVSTRSLSVHTGEGESVCNRVLKAFINAGMIEDGRVAAWDKRQPSSDDSAPRQKNFRARRQNEQSYNPLERNKTNGECHVTVTPLRTESDIEKRERIKPPFNSPHEIAAVAACANEEQTSFIEPPPRPKPSRAERVKATEQEFEAFWTEVPKGRKTGKLACQRKFATLVASGKATGEQIRERMHEYAELCREKATPLGSIKHPETWLNKGCWADEEQVVPSLDGLVPVCNGNQMPNAYQRDQRPPGVRPGRITNAILEYSKMTGYDIRNLRI